MKAVSLLRVDPDLAAPIGNSRREAAERACVARTLEIPRGTWDPGSAGDGGDRGGFGLLILSGLLCRRVAQNGCSGAELIGPGDLLRPWEGIGEWASIPTSSSWLAIEPTEVAILDADFAHRATPFPEIAFTLVKRGLLRSRHLTILVAIICQRRVETRLNMLFWHLADRFGRMRGEWVSVPVPLTHSLLGELVAARRPSVTTALTHLQRSGALRRDDNGWLLRGPAPPTQWQDTLTGQAAAE